MSDSKIDFSFENLHFSCEGDNAWVEKQLNNVLSRIPALLSVHKKGESIVEEVIEVREEDVKVQSPHVPETKIVKPPKEKKPKVAKVAKEKAVQVKIVKEKLVKEPKVAVVKEDKAVVAPKVKAAKVPKEAVKAVPGKRGRKPKIVEEPVAEVKVVKKKTDKTKPVDQVDSPLFQYLTDKKVISNQVRKFLATAIFLARNNNVTKLSTPMISRALKSYGIEKLQNASDCLNKNEKKGYCIKEGKEFIITENGYLSIE